MNQEAKDNHGEPCVVHLHGWSGTGKTFGLEEFERKHPGSIQILTPDSLQQPFDVSIVDFNNYECVAIDEASMWEAKSVASAISKLIIDAKWRGKKIILVTQAEDDLGRMGIELSTEPMKVCLGGRHETLDLTYDGKHVRFREPARV